MVYMIVLLKEHWLFERQSHVFICKLNLAAQHTVSRMKQSDSLL